MKFKNLGEPIKIRIGKSENCYWNTIRKNEIVDLPFERGKRIGFTKLKTTEGQLGPKKVETKQIDHSKNKNDKESYSKKLNEIKGREYGS